MSTVYLLHFDIKIAHAQHYCGSAKNLKKRLKQHAEGGGARLMAVCRERGITWRLARTWEGGRTLERKIKNQKNAPHLCPICQKERE